MDLGALSASGVLRLHDHPYLRLKGAGTLVAVIDSGIDYQHPAFRNGDQSKILSIWDQSLPGGRSGRIPIWKRIYQSSDQRGTCCRKSAGDRALNRSETDTEPGLLRQPQETGFRKKIFPGRHRKQSW